MSRTVMAQELREHGACCDAPVRFTDEHCNFYCTECDKGQGESYYLRHAYKDGEFPGDLRAIQLRAKP